MQHGKYCFHGILVSNLCDYTHVMYTYGMGIYICICYTNTFCFYTVCDMFLSHV